MIDCKKCKHNNKVNNIFSVYHEFCSKDHCVLCLDGSDGDCEDFESRKKLNTISIKLELDTTEFEMSLKRIEKSLDMIQKKKQLINDLDKAHNKIKIITDNSLEEISRTIKNQVKSLGSD